MKKIIFLFLAFAAVQSMVFTARAQLWESLPMLHFDRVIRDMYYDSADEVSYIFGEFKHVNDTACDVVVWDGAGYRLLPPSPLYATTRAVRYGDKIYMGSGYGLVTWDGTAWNVIDSNAGVYSLHIHDDKLYVTGAFKEIAGQKIGKVAVWNDTAWSDVYALDTVLQGVSDNVYAIAFYKGNVYVGGNFYNAAYPGMMDLAMFDGQRWRDVGGFTLGGLGFVNFLLVWKDTLYVAGLFPESEGSPGNSVAKWDGENWHKMGKGLSGSFGYIGAEALSLYNEELYACGNFNIMDGILLGERVANVRYSPVKWDGERWCSMGTRTNGAIISLGRWKDDLYALGAFTQINGMPAQYIAKWIGGDYTDSCSDPLAVRLPVAEMSIHVYPNPSADVFNISCIFTEMGAADVTLAIMDITGRPVSETGLTLKPGVNTFALDLKGLPPGSYFMHINGTDVKGSLQLVKQ